MVNILSNSLQYTFEGSISLSIKIQRSNLLFKVTDTGLGIKDELKPHLFKMINQNRENPNGTGKGLGLTLCKKLVEAMHGEISLHSVLR